MTRQERADICRGYYDDLGDAEWDRLTRDAPARVSLEMHRRLLARHIRPGQRVLEIGAGPGRFTAELAALGATVVVTDISPVQLELNASHLVGTPAEEAVERRELVDVCDTSRFSDSEFDAVVALGGPLSYAFEDEVPATQGLLRVTRPGGVVLGSVMSVLGTWRHALRGVSAIAAEVGEDLNDAVLRTGDLRHLGARPHVCRMFRSREIEELAARCGARVVEMSASNWASLGDPETVANLEQDPDRWARFLENEHQACSEPGAVDGGTHILFALAHADPAECTTGQ